MKALQTYYAPVDNEGIVYGLVLASSAAEAAKKLKLNSTKKIRINRGTIYRVEAKRVYPKPLYFDALDLRFPQKYTQFSTSKQEILERRERFAYKKAEV